ncbi:DNA translocase FtsK [Acetobacterium woodii]|uniref:DNA translocase FtsK n=1 Tax=Acetobacterium woodii (strain ATCC 29683 / DSM 1030 / JCM 2381 / KCTC 1655 / WB1) TaxID=931626 RepID=H6LJX8_ACEWD|nr:DNA translocase FtsK [Acetobacterium woodii]AFA48732.1 DNA translocase FtsK [Acetobacterium woodii DSM 1030]
MATTKNNPNKPNQNKSKKVNSKKKKPKKVVKKFTVSNLAAGIFLIILGLFSAYAYIDFNAGMIGDLVSQGFSYCFGTVTLFMSIYIFVMGVMISLNKMEGWTNTFVLVFLLFINLMIGFSIYAPNLMDYSILELFSLAQYGQYGGIIGILLAVLFIKLFAVKGTLLIVFASSAIILIFIFRNSLKKYWDKIKDQNKNNPPLKNQLKNRIESIRDRQKIKKEVKATKERTSETTMIPLVGEHEDNGPLFEPYQINEPSNKALFEPVTGVTPSKKKKTKQDPFGFIEEEIDEKETPMEIHENFSKPQKMDDFKFTNKENTNADETKVMNLAEVAYEIKAEAYIFPSLDLLNPPVIKKKSKKDDVLKKAKTIEETLKNFGVKAKIVEVNVGPSITRFELQLDPGVKVNKFVNLSNDLALSLATSDIRIEAPIPGKAAVGIEVPNDVSEIVGLREIIETPQFIESKSPLTFALGKTLSGENVIGDIGKMPHVLIAGATGSGKSVCINSIIVSLIFKASPDELRFIMIDPKMVELNQYNAIPHLLIPVVTDPKKASYALNWGLKEMTDRYLLFKNAGVRDIETYNDFMTKSNEKKLPRIVIVIDELADLMITSPKECENAICRIAQLARACGIHLIIATQRPSVDVITGLIKANIPSRIAFSVASNTDSRTILDTGGAEKLLGKGDMLYFPVGQSKPTRVQCTYVSDSEINAVINAIKPKTGHQYDASIEEAISQEPEEKQESREGDVLLEDALNIAFEYDQVSTSMLQRKLQVGYARAGRIIDDMEERGIISGPNGSKPRKILVTEDEFRKRE